MTKIILVDTASIVGDKRWPLRCYEQRLPVGHEVTKRYFIFKIISPSQANFSHSQQQIT